MTQVEHVSSPRDKNTSGHISSTVLGEERDERGGAELGGIGSKGSHEGLLTDLVLQLAKEG